MAYGTTVLVLAVFGCTEMLAPAKSARILAIELAGMRSYWNFMSSVARSLMESGHDLTIFTPFTDMDGCGENCTLIDTSKDFSSVNLVGMDLVTLLSSYGAITPSITNFVNNSRMRCNSMYDNEDFKKILNTGDGSGYDVLLIEPMVSECASHVATTLRVPVIYLSPSTSVTFTELLFFGHAPNPTVVSHVNSRHAFPVTFAQRFANVVLSAYALILRAQYERMVKDSEPRSYDSVDVTKPSLVFVNSHHITDRSRPVPQNCVAIGGIHLGQPSIIPKDTLEFIENSPHGVIYFTFGSMALMSTFPDHIHNAFKEALKQVPQRVLWKYEVEMKDKPKNVMTSKWFPQRDILMHPKVKLFISHGGISGIYEAVDAGVPVLGFPLFFDQNRNIDNLVEAGMAISMDLLKIRKDVLLKNILKLINNNTYMENAKIASSIFKDRPMSPKQSVVYWTEYVIRHKGAPHLKSHALNLTWYQYYLLDVIAVLLIVLLLLCFIVCKIFEVICNSFSRNSKRFKRKLE